MSDIEETELEKQFKETVESVQKQIKEKMEVARFAIREAVSLAEQHGVPFYANISPLGQTYWPSSFYGKFGKLDSDVVFDIASAWTDEVEYGGWQHSAVC
jgi:hypothetical protein